MARIKLGDILKQALQDIDGSFSSKRLITIGSFFLMAIGFGVSTFTVFRVPDNIYNNLMYIVLGGLGISGTERFANIFGNNPPTPEPPTPTPPTGEITPPPSANSA